MLKLVPISEPSLKELGGEIRHPAADFKTSTWRETWRSSVKQETIQREPSERRRRRRVPDRTARVKGWSQLVAEIDESAKRTRVAKGGYVMTQERPSPQTPRGAAADEPASNYSETLWDSYKVDEEKVPDSVLTILWCRASDPRRWHADKSVQPLPRLPRLTVISRDVEELPVVHSLPHWREVKKHSREARVLDEAGDCYPTLVEMMTIIFGELSEASPSTVATPAEEKEEGGAADEIEMDSPSHRRLVSTPPPRKGVLRKGRRPAFDEGQPQTVGRSNTTATLCELDANKGRPKESLLMRKFRIAQGDDHSRTALDDMTTTSFKVSERCQRKLDRVRKHFLRKQGTLSARLVWRVHRIQEDADQLREVKVSSILPSTVAKEVVAVSARSSASPRGTKKATVTAEGSPDQADVPHTVLHFLKQHRRHAEKARKRQDEMYLRQVEHFQTYLRLIADPNRPPERGELYLSDCFRYVLSAGLLVDETYFFRVLARLEREDFERAATLNLIAACCHVFDIDLGKYCSFLSARQLPGHSLRARPDKVKSWEDWAPWAGMEVVHNVLLGLQPATLESTPGEAALHVLEPGTGEQVALDSSDPLFHFRPVLPDEAPDSSEPISRDEDPLMQILNEVALDAVLARYALSERRDQRFKRDGAVSREAYDHEAFASGGKSPRTREPVGALHGQLALLH
mmetsp:Transcript_5197/g.12512  ORF Transcript_5197/g.12512 Transcript_5197/m.12512 type:complete len:688 (-) Transcript_5197:66-2129(-)